MVVGQSWIWSWGWTWQNCFCFRNGSLIQLQGSGDGDGHYRGLQICSIVVLKRHQEFWNWSLWAEAIFAYRNCQWRDLLIRQLLSNSYWFIPDNDSSKHYIYLFKGSFWIIVGFAQVTIRIESWRIKSRIFERRDFLFYQTRPVAD